MAKQTSHSLSLKPGASPVRHPLRVRWENLRSWDNFYFGQRSSHGVSCVSLRGNSTINSCIMARQVGRFLYARHWFQDETDGCRWVRQGAMTQDSGHSPPQLLSPQHQAHLQKADAAQPLVLYMVDYERPPRATRLCLNLGRACDLARTGSPTLPSKYIRSPKWIRIKRYVSCNHMHMHHFPFSHITTLKL